MTASGTLHVHTPIAGLVERGPGGPADYEKLMPVTYAMAAVLLVVGLFVMAADVVNPIRLAG